MTVRRRLIAFGVFTLGLLVLAAICVLVYSYFYPPTAPLWNHH